MDMEEDRRLVDGARAGDRRAVRDLVERYQGLVSRVVFRIVRDSGEREEVCQDSFVRVFRGLDSFRFESKLSTWIARIAYRTALNHLEKRRLLLYDDLAGPATDAHESTPSAVERLPAETASALEAAEASEVRAFLRTQIEKLPAAYRAVVTLFHLEEMSIAEVSAATEMPEGTVKNYLFRARRILKDKVLERYAAEELLQ